MELSLEQEFSLQSFNNQVDKLSKEDAIALLKQLNRHNLCQKVTYNNLLKKAWNIGEPLNEPD